MKTSLSFAIVASALVMLCACQDDALEPAPTAKAREGFSWTQAQTRASDRSKIVEEQALRIDTLLRIDLEEGLEITRSYSGKEIISAPIGADEALELHLSILPLYAFGTSADAGDYYGVQGYVLMHNDRLANIQYGEDLSVPYGQQTLTAYLKNMLFEMQLLDDEGQPVSNQDVWFFNTPEPSTTIGSCTYKKGWNLSLKLPLTLGRKVNAEDEWEGVLDFVPLPSFSHIDESVQNLPMQVVEMSTDPFNRSVSYSFKGNYTDDNVSQGKVPAEFCHDQRIDFSWVWHVNAGTYHAKDYDYGHMKFRVNLHPRYKLYTEATYQDSDLDGKPMRGFHTAVLEVSTQPVENTFTVDLPSLNRTPAGTVCLKNCSANYLTEVEIFPHNYVDTGDKEGCRIDGHFARNEEGTSLLCVGSYDVYYTLVNGNTGARIGRYRISDVKIEQSKQTNLASYDGEKINP